MLTSFEIIDTTSQKRSFLGERETFEAAEAFARWHAARRDIRVTVRRVEKPEGRPTMKIRPWVREEMATVSRDPLGRLWTDLTWVGAALV